MKNVAQNTLIQVVLYYEILQRFSLKFNNNSHKHCAILVLKTDHLKYYTMFLLILTPKEVVI